ncbi:hypothetical protein CAPTEDRAFT_186946 [Capitella teleta]|uniref:G-protein coupled receptors family 1 profile domain-containing protein n=1 Tax=Capitella teleta TaxID=283909 RepID=R7TGF6_CAPTE|nr:hypothetical protein CAPTEDRAFT_186946 [Capitella teleta]|eukprot:ELT92577.1 hypothetical protein CAPTEDRAFT_186946 [Capitella teleta]
MNSSEVLNSTVECHKYGAYRCTLTVVNWALAFFGNTFTILTMLKTKEGIGKKGRAYIISLSCFDLLMSPILTADLTLGYLGGLCQPLFPPYTKEVISWVPTLRRNRSILGAFYSISLVGSLLVMMTISLDRLLAVSKPLFYKHNITIPRIRILVAGIWVYVGTLGLFIFCYFSQQSTDVQVLSGLYNGSILPPWAYKYVLQAHVYLTIAGTFLSSGLAIHFVKKLDKKPGTGSNSVKSSARTKRVLKMTLATLISLLLLYCPFLLVTSLLDDKKGTSPQWMYDYLLVSTNFLTQCNSGINPLIYSCFNEDFKNAYKRMLRTGRNRVWPQANSSSVTGTMSLPE